MTQVQERAVEIIQRIPEEKMTFVLNFLQNVEKVVEAHDVSNEEKDKLPDGWKWVRLACFLEKYHTGYGGIYVCS